MIAASGHVILESAQDRMRFVLLGNHPDGVALAAALASSGRHLLATVTPKLPAALAAVSPRIVSDIEEVLADPAIDAVIVAGPASVRPVQLRRALQSERHVLCVHPADQSPEIAYEAAMLQTDTGCVLLPLLPASFHPALRRLVEVLGLSRSVEDRRADDKTLRAVLCEWTSRGEVLAGLDIAGQKPSIPGWDVLRCLGGEIAEVSAFAEAEDFAPGQDVFLAGRFERGGLFQLCLLPARGEDSARLTVLTERGGRAELYFPQGESGPAFLNWREPGKEQQEEYWQSWAPWPIVIEEFEAAVEKRPQRLTWQDAVRALELDDAARRSVARRRTVVLEYQEASEEVGFKGTMTLVGCSVLLLSLVLLVLMAWDARAGWLVVPLLAGFLLLQSLRALASRGRETPGGPH